MYDPFLHFYPIQPVAFLSRSNSAEALTLYIAFLKDLCHPV